MSVMTSEQCVNLVMETLETYQDEATNKDFGVASDWTVKVSYGNPNILGETYQNAKVIVISANHIEDDTLDEVVETILHECAHALAGRQFYRKREISHGKKWRDMAVKVGAKPYATQERMEEATAKKYNFHIISISDQGVEVHCSCMRRLVGLEERSYPGKEYTIGNLYHIAVDDYARLEGDIEGIRKVAFR